MTTDIRTQIKTALNAFGNTDLRTASIGLLNTLGYQSDKALELESSPQAFLDQYNQHPEYTSFSAEKALVNEWQEIHLLFQIIEGFAQLADVQFKLVERFFVQEVVIVPVSVHILGLPVFDVRHGECGVVSLESPLYYRSAEEVLHLYSGNGRPLLHLVALVIHYLPGLVVQLNDHSLA